MKKSCTFLCLLILNYSFAQDINTLEPVNITNSRTLQKNSATGKNISIIEGKLFERLPVMSIDDLLKYASGVEMQQRGPAGAQSDIIIRGGTFQQVLVLIDGLKMNDPITGHFAGYMPITPSEIERIEIVKGPAAAMYGSEAVGGVVNIISKTGYAYQSKKSKSITGMVTAGEFGLININAGIHGTGEKLNYSIGVLSNNADGQPLRSNNKGYFHNHTFSGSLSKQLGKNWQLFLHSSYDMRDFAAQNFYTPFASDTATEKVNTFWNHARLKNSSGNATDQFDAIYKKTNDNYSFNPLSIPNKNQSDLIQFQYLHTHNIKNINSVFGFYIENRKITSNDRGNHSNNHGAIFGSAVIQMHKFNINPGIRIVNDENYGTEVLPQLNASYVSGKLVVRGGAGRAIRAADFTERFNNYNKTLVKGGSIGNPDLVAERSWSYEIGSDLNFQNLRLSATGFYRSQRKLIDFVSTPFSEIPRNQNLDPTGKFAYAKNLKTADTKGLEFEASYAEKINKDLQVIFTASALILDTKTSEANPSYYILSHAKLLIQKTFILQYKGVEFSFNSIYKERTAQAAAGINAVKGENYWLHNARLRYSFRNFSAFVNVNNLRNISYVDLLGSKMPGRWISSGISFNLNK